jgi:hypothetical protein
MTISQELTMLSVAVSILLSSLGMVSRDMPLAHCAREPSEIVAAYVPGEITLDAAHPAAEWNKARPIVFCSGWQGKNPDEQCETEARVLWSAQTLYLRFDCKYRERSSRPPLGPGCDRSLPAA